MGVSRMMVLTVVTWGNTMETDTDDYLTAEILLDMKMAWDSIDMARKKKPKQIVKSVDFYEVKGYHDEH